MGFTHLVKMTLDKGVHCLNQAQFTAKMIVQGRVVLVASLAVDHTQGDGIYPMFGEQIDSGQNKFVLGILRGGEIGFHGGATQDLSHIY